MRNKKINWDKLERNNKKKRKNLNPKRTELSVDIFGLTLLQHSYLSVKKCKKRSHKNVKTGQIFILARIN